MDPKGVLLTLTISLTDIKCSLFPDKKCESRMADTWTCVKAGNSISFDDQNKQQAQPSLF